MSKTIVVLALIIGFLFGFDVSYLLFEQGLFKVKSDYTIHKRVKKVTRRYKIN